MKLVHPPAPAAAGADFERFTGAAAPAGNKPEACSGDPRAGAASCSASCRTRQAQGAGAFSVRNWIVNAS